MEGPGHQGGQLHIGLLFLHSSGCQQTYPRWGFTGPLDHCLNTTYISVNFKNSCKAFWRVCSGQELHLSFLSQCQLYFPLLVIQVELFRGHG